MPDSNLFEGGLGNPKGPNYTNRKSDFTLDKVQGLISSILAFNPNHMIVGTTGSSGRNEEYAALDELELILYIDSNMEQEDVEPVKNLITQSIGKSGSIIFEQKSRLKPEFFEGVEGRFFDKPVFFPSRFIDFLQLHGTEQEYDSLIEIFLGNIKSHSRDTIDTWRKRVSTHKKISESGKIVWRGGEYPIYDDSQKLLHYSKSSGGLEVSIKIGALRYIQYQIIQMLLILIRKNSITLDSFKSIGSGVESKIDFLSEQGLGLSMIQVQELKGLYAFFLGIHNQVSKVFQKKESGSMIFSEEDYRIFKERLDDFNSIMTEFRLKS